MTTRVILRFDQSLLGCVYDKFGEDTKIERVDETTLRAKVQVQISSVFFGWVFQFEGKMRIEGPKSVKDKFYSVLQGMENNKEL